MKSMSKKEFSDMYNSMTNEHLAHQLGVSVGTIKNMLKRYGIRKKGKGNRLSKSILKLT